MKRELVFLLIIGSLSGCAKSVVAPYSINFIDDRVYEVNVPGTYPEVMRSYSVYRAAEQAEKLGCSYFFAIDNKGQSLSVSGSNYMDDSFKQDNGISYYYDGGSRYKIIQPSGRSNMFACTSNKPNGIIPGLFYKSSLVLKSDIPRYQKPGFFAK